MSDPDPLPPGTTPPNPPEPQRPSFLARVRAALASASGLATNLAATVVLSILVTVAGWMAIEQTLFWLEDDHTQTTAKRDFLCNEHSYSIPPADTSAQNNSDANSANLEALQEIQEKIVEIYALKELARQHAIPFDTVGRVRHFFRCGYVTDVSANTLKFTFTEGQRAPFTQDLRALLEWEMEGWKLVDREFAGVVPPIIRGAWRQRLDLLGNSLSRIDTKDAPLATEEQSEPNAALVQTLKLISPMSPEIAQAWLLIVGSDIAASAALTEVRKLRAALSKEYAATFQGEDKEVTIAFEPSDAANLQTYVAMFSTGTRIRTAVAFENRESAEIARQVLQKEGLIRLDAYTRDVGTWCSAPPAREDGGDDAQNSEAIYTCN